MSTQTLHDVLTTKEVAEYLRVPEVTVETYAQRLAIPGRQIGEEWRFSRLVIDRWLAGQSGKAVLISQAGALADDLEDLEELRASIQLRSSAATRR